MIDCFHDFCLVYLAGFALALKDPYFVGQYLQIMICTGYRFGYLIATKDFVVWRAFICMPWWFSRLVYTH